MKHTIVMGDGWSALASVGFLLKQGEWNHKLNQELGKESEQNVATSKITWIRSVTPRVIPILPTIEVHSQDEHSQMSVAGWLELFKLYQIDAGEPRQGYFLREYKNKNFTKPTWLRSANLEQREEVKQEYLWAPEARFLGDQQIKFQDSFYELEEKLRSAILCEIQSKAQAKTQTDNQVRVIEGNTVQGFKFSEIENEQDAVILANGESIHADHFIYADRWSQLSSLGGLPKNIAGTRGHDPVGALQCIFTHDQVLPWDGAQESYFSFCNRDAGETFDRATWGYFIPGTTDKNGQKIACTKSVWTVLLDQDEGLDNHTVAKKFRKMKQALEKMFDQILTTVQKESVLFVENAVFSKGKKITKPVQFKSLSFLTDGDGCLTSMEQVMKCLQIKFAEPVAFDVSAPTEAVIEASESN
jgi:hypothetical protein